MIWYKRTTVISLHPFEPAVLLFQTRIRDQVSSFYTRLRLRVAGNATHVSIPVGTKTEVGPFSSTCI